MTTNSNWDEGVWDTFVWDDVVARPDQPLTWLLDVDWDDDGYFSGENEAMGADSNGTPVNRLLDIDVTRGRHFFINGSGTGFEPFDKGSMSIHLLDLDGRYNAYNASSPIYSYLSRNQRIMLRVQDNATGIVYPVFFGYIQDVRSNMGAVVSTATITAEDGFCLLQEANVNCQTIFQNMRYNLAIDRVLRDANWLDGSDIDTVASDTMPFWWERGNKALEELQDLVDAAFGMVFIDASGRVKYLSNIASDSSVIVLTEDEIDYEYGIQSPSLRTTIRNWVQIYARARKQQNSAVLWTATDKPSIAAGATLEVWANYSYSNESCPALSVVTPVATTDYTANTAQDGSGTDKTSAIVVTLTKFGESAKIQYRNTDAGTVYMTLMQLRGVAITVDPYTFSQVQDDDSIAIYKQRNLIIKSDWLQSLNTAIDKATALKQKLATPRQFPEVKIRKGELQHSFTPDLGNLVTVNLVSKNISDEFRVGYIHHAWSVDEPGIVTTEMHFEPNLFANAVGTWIFPAMVGVTTKFA